MWNRSMVKSNAKQVLKLSYWLSFGVCLVASILQEVGAASSFNYWYGSNFWFKEPSFTFFNTISMIVIFIFIILFAFVFSVFLMNPIETGKCTFFIRATYGESLFENLFFVFKSGRYIPVVKTMFIRDLKIFLWSLLFIVPGIIKSYEYRMVPYIISEDPSLSPRDAINLSCRMTKGEKGAMFILDLSFFGWYLLGMLALGFGVIFVIPYVEATYAQLYLLLKSKVMPTNITATPGL